MHMPSSEERGESGQNYRANEAVERGLSKNRDQARDLQQDCDQKGVLCGDGGEDAKGRVADQTASGGRESSSVEGEVEVLSQGCLGNQHNHDPIRKRVQCPKVGSPVRVGETALEGEQTAGQLGKLV